MTNFLDQLGTKKSLTTSGGTHDYYSFDLLEKRLGVSVNRLPYSMRVLLESVLRNCDGEAVTENHVKLITNWSPEDKEREEIPYKPARVVLQDFTGVPAVVDLAAMRDAMVGLGGDPKRINPLVQCDLVIDHSVQVDYFGRGDALSLNEKLEFERNRERYEFLKWGQGTFNNFRVVPPSTGIVHQVNLEYLSSVVYLNQAANTLYPDSCVGTDSHTPMVNGLGVVAWGVGGIEAEVVLLNQPMYMLVPDVIGVRLTGALPEGTTATDLVLRITELLREVGVVGKFVEFMGPGLDELSLADRATIGNMAPEQGSTVSFFPVDDKTLEYLRLTGRGGDIADRVERYSKEQGLFRTSDAPEPVYTKVVELDLSTVEAAIAGPKRPQDRIPLSKVGPTYEKTLTDPVGPKGLGVSPERLSDSATITVGEENTELKHGSVVIAAITSCTNTSNPSVMLAAGLVAQKAVEKGLKVAPFVKTSLAPGSGVVTSYLEKANLLKPLEELGFHVVGYGCTTCIGNSGPLPEPVSKGIQEKNLVVSAVLSGNRNFEGRVNPLTQTNYLASPPLVVAYSLFGTTAKDITTEPIGVGKDGNEVFLKDIWPSTKEVREVLQAAVDSDMFTERYSTVWEGSKAWKDIKAESSLQYPWAADSTYVQSPPFFDGMSLEEQEIHPIEGARVLGLFGDSVTTDHISPAGSIAKNSPAAQYLRSHGVEDKDFNTYGSRRGNDRVMHRGTFANIRIKNRLVPGSEGNITVHHPSGEQLSFFDASEKYRESKTPLMILAGKEYGSGSSRDWAAKGPFLMGIQVVIAESYERIHRSNLIGMGILPLQFKSGESASSLGLNGTETYSVQMNDTVKPGGDVSVAAISEDGKKVEFTATCRIDTPVEIRYYRDGGILRSVLKDLAS